MKYNYTSKRVGATLIDYTLVYALTFTYIFKAGTPDVDGGYKVSGLPALVPVAFWFLYFVIAEYFLGGTLGHQLFKLKVIPSDGSSLTFGQIVKRRICDIIEISWCFGLIAYLIVKSNKDGQRLGDQLARTIVVGKYDQPLEEKFDFENA